MVSAELAERRDLALALLTPAVLINMFTPFSRCLIDLVARGLGAGRPDATLDCAACRRHGLDG